MAAVPVRWAPRPVAATRRSRPASPIPSPSDSWAGRAALPLPLSGPAGLFLNSGGRRAAVGAVALGHSRYVQVRDGHRANSSPEPTGSSPEPTGSSPETGPSPKPAGAAPEPTSPGPEPTSSSPETGPSPEPAGAAPEPTSAGQNQRDPAQNQRVPGREQWAPGQSRTECVSSLAFFLYGPGAAKRWPTTRIPPTQGRVENCLLRRYSAPTRRVEWVAARWVIWAGRAVRRDRAPPEFRL
jgi:hypothetical protein